MWDGKIINSRVKPERGRPDQGISHNARDDDEDADAHGHEHSPLARRQHRLVLDDPHGQRDEVQVGGNAQDRVYVEDNVDRVGCIHYWSALMKGGSWNAL